MENKTSSRILSVDIMRGLTLFLMLFVNDLYEPGVPHWLVHAKGNFDGMGLADWVFPGFLFMVGMAVPYAVSSRIKKGDSGSKILLHIFLRTLSLLIIGFFVINGDEYLNENLTGMYHIWWLACAYLCFFLIWNNYPANKYKTLFLVLKLLGIAGLAALAYIFKSGDSNHVSWMHTGWWGILGLIGWGYLVASLAYYFIKDKLPTAVLVWIFFIILNMLSQSGKLGFLDFLNPVLNVVIDGNVPSIVLSGMVLSILLRNKIIANQYKLILSVSALGALYIIVGFVLRHWFIISKIQGTPSWAMICNGISMIIFALLYFIVDINHRIKWSYMFNEAGKNSLTTYLAPDIIYYVTWGLNISIYFYKQDNNTWLAVGGSLVWAFVMIWFVIFLSRIKIRLKL